MQNISLLDLRDVLYKEESFFQFMNKVGIFSGVNTENYVDNLNSYMKLILLFDVTDVPKEVFDRINEINSKFSLNQFYNYYNSLDGQGKILSTSFIESILVDDDVFKMFMDFPNNKHFFGNVSLESYLRSIKFYLKFALEHKLPVDVKIAQHYKQISFKYAEFLPSNKLVGKVPSGEIDSEFERSVLTSVDFTKPKFLVALQIYINLLNSTTYDPNIKANKIDVKNPDLTDLKNIYFKKTKNVTIKNNRTVCTTISDLFALLLIKCGFKARVINEFHAYTIFDCDGELIKADPSILIRDNNGFSMMDFTRSKLGLPIEGFSYFSGDGDISNKINKAYQELKIEPTFMLDVVNLLNQGIEKTDFEKRIDVLNEKSKATSLVDLDYVGYISSLTKSIFSVKELMKINVYNIYIKSLKNYHVGLLISRDTESGTEYYLAHNVVGVGQITKEQLSQMLREGNFIIHKKDENIKRLESMKVGGPKK